MPRFLPCALAFLLRLAPACGLEDASALVQKSLVTFDEYYDQFFHPSQEELQKFWTYRTGQRVQVEGYSPDQNVTIIGYGVDHERYHLAYGRDGTIMNIEGKFLKKWVPTYPHSTDPAAGPVAFIEGFEYQGQPYIVRRGEKQGTWDVYIPSMGLVPNINDASIVREASWRRTSSTQPPKEPSLMAVLFGRVPEGYSYSHKNKVAASASTTLAPQAKKSFETIYLDRKGETEAPPEKPALKAVQPPLLPPFVPPMVPPPYMMRPPPQAPPAAAATALGRKTDEEKDSAASEEKPLDSLRKQEQVMARRNQLARSQGKRRLEKREKQLKLDQTFEDRTKQALENQLKKEEELEVGQKMLDKHQVLERKVLDEEIEAIQQQNEQRSHLLSQKLEPMEELSESQRILKDQLRRTRNMETELQNGEQVMSRRSAQQDTANKPSTKTAAKASSKTAKKPLPTPAHKSGLMTKLYLRRTEAQREEEQEEEEEEEGAEPTPEEGAKEQTGKETEADRAARLAQPVKMKPGRKLVVLDVDGDGLGFTASQFQGSYQEKMLFVTSVEDSGAATKWNQEHPLKALTQGERILQVNGEGGNSQTLQQLLWAANATGPGGKVYLLMEKVGKSAEDRVADVIETIKEVAVKGPRGYVREALPFGLGKVFMNKAGSVRGCNQISSQYLCGVSKKKYNLACAGWSGETCLTPEQVQCESITNEAVCKDAKTKFGLTCAGWGGTTCLSKGAHPSKIKSPEICEHAEKRLGILVAGWGGHKCLAWSDNCSKITLPGLCHNSESKLGKSCLGWGGSSCLEHGAKVESITTEHLCRKSMELFGLESAGWGGDACLSKEALRCGLITDPTICASAEEKLGRKCAGWGGSSCLELGAGPRKITDEAICQKSKAKLGIESGGWSGARCLPAGPAKCADVERPGVCNDASARLGITCAGWSGKECLSPEEMKCNRVTKKNLCQTSAERFGLPCVWNGDMCLPDTSPSK